jgi:hypothetical protein
MVALLPEKALPQVTATILIKFPEFVEETLDGILIAQIDTREDGLNLGDVSFQPGDNIGFLVYKNSKIVNLKLLSSVGNIVTIVSSGVRTVTEDVSFIHKDTASVQFPISGGITPEWVGFDRGPVNIQNDRDLVLANGVTTGILRVTYDTIFTGYSLQNTPSQLLGSPEYPVLITVVGEIIE